MNKSPFIIVIATLIAGALVSLGIVDHQGQDQLIALLTDFLSALVWAVTVGYSVSQFFRHKNHEITTNAQLQRDINLQNPSRTPVFSEPVQPVSSSPLPTMTQESESLAQPSYEGNPHL